MIVSYYPIFLLIQLYCINIVRYNLNGSQHFYVGKGSDLCVQWLSQTQDCRIPNKWLKFETTITTKSIEQSGARDK